MPVTYLKRPVLRPNLQPPAVLQTSVAWWEPTHSENILADGATTFSQLTDLSGNGNHLTQGTTARRPTVLYSGQTRSAELDGVDNQMTCAGSARLMNNFNNGGTSFFVFRPDTAGQNNFGRIWDKSGAVETYYNAFESGGSLKTAWGYDFTTTDYTGDYDVQTVPLGEKAVFIQRWDKTVASTAAIVHRINGIPYTVASSPGLNPYDPSPVGSPADLSGNTFIFGDRADDVRAGDGGLDAMAFWDYELSDDQLVELENYSVTKFGVVLD